MTEGNGENEYGVTFGRIMFLQKIIEGHDNVKSFLRRRDIVFDVDRVEQGDTIKIVCVDEYTISETIIRKIFVDFPDVDVIFVGGKWNHASAHGSALCRKKKVGVYNAGTINAGLRKTQFWA
jgi:hypothetical protein